MFFSIILYFIMPLIFRTSPLQYEFPKIIFFYLISILILIFFLLKKVRILFDKYWIGWLSILAISSLLSERFIAALIGDGFRHQGIIFFLVLSLFTYCLKIFPHYKLKLILWLISFTTIFESLLFIVNKYFNNPIFRFGTLGEINSFAGFLMLGIPIILEVLPFPFLIIPITAIILSGSKTAILSLIVELLLIVFWKKKKEKKILALILVPILMLGIFGVWQERNISVFESRWKIWKLGISAIAEKPLLGYGAEGIVKAYDLEFAKANLPLENFSIDRAHNLVLDILLYSGILGFVFFFKWFLENLKASKFDWQIIGLIGLMFFSFFQPIGIVFWIYLIFFLTYSKDKRILN